MSDIKTGRASDQFPLRLPEGMRERIKTAAEVNGRSMNAEIVAALTEKFPEPVDLEFEKLFEMAERLAPGEFARLTQALLDRDLASGKITEKDLEDGLVPGFTVRRVPVEH
ncbi:hypothetical protein GCM10009081_28790 [Brevundimonas nasdae]